MGPKKVAHIRKGIIMWESYNIGYIGLVRPLNGVLKMPI